MSEEMKVPPIWQAMDNDGETIVADGNDMDVVAARVRGMGFPVLYVRRNPALAKHWPWLPMTDKPLADTEVWITILWKWDGTREVVEGRAVNGHVVPLRRYGEPGAIELLAWRPREVPTPFEGRWDE